MRVAMRVSSMDLVYSWMVLYVSLVSLGGTGGGRPCELFKLSTWFWYMWFRLFVLGREGGAALFTMYATLLSLICRENYEMLP